jgi:hypothetical protein
VNSLEAIAKKAEAVYPLPVASVFRKLRTADPERHHELHALTGDLTEVVVKLLSLAALQDFRGMRPLPEYLESFLGSMLHPSLGHFNELLRYVAAEDTTGMRFATLVGDFCRGKLPQEIRAHASTIQGLLQTDLALKTNKDVLDLLNVYRNKGKGHGASLTTEEYRERMESLLPIAVHILKELSFFERFEFFYVDEVRVVATGELSHKLKIAIGTHLEPRQELRVEALVPEHFYLATLDSEPRDRVYIDLHPFIISHVRTPALPWDAPK